MPAHTQNERKEGKGSGGEGSREERAKNRGKERERKEEHKGVRNDGGEGPPMATPAAPPRPQARSTPPAHLLLGNATSLRGFLSALHSHQHDRASLKFPPSHRSFRLRAPPPVLEFILTLCTYTLTVHIHYVHAEWFTRTFHPEWFIWFIPFG